MDVTLEEKWWLYTFLEGRALPASCLLQEIVTPRVSKSLGDVYCNIQAIFQYVLPAIFQYIVIGVYMHQNLSLKASMAPHKTLEKDHGLLHPKP